MRLQKTTRAFAASCLLAVVAFDAETQEASPAKILITDVRIFDGKNDRLTPGSVLVEDNLIKSIGQNLNASADVMIVNGNGKTLMPGLIDGHVHIMINDDYGAVERDHDPYDLAIRATVVAERFLMDGFTAVRDMGGPAFAIQRNIDAGLIVGTPLVSVWGIHFTDFGPW